MNAASSIHLKKQLDEVIAEVAAQMHVPEQKVRKVLAERYGSSRLKSLASMAFGFFRPSKRANNATIKVGSLRIDRDTVREFPSQGGDRRLTGETTRFFSDVELKLVAQDLDRPGKGWAGIIEKISAERVSVQVCSPVTPDQIFARRSIRADVVALMRLEDDGSYAPTKYQVIRWYE